MVRDVRTSCAGMERGDGTSCLNVCSCGRGDTSRSGDTTGAVGHMHRHCFAPVGGRFPDRHRLALGGKKRAKPAVPLACLVHLFHSGFITVRGNSSRACTTRLRQAAMMHRQLTTVSRHGEPQSRSNHACSALLGRSGPCLTIIRRPPPPAMSTRSERRHKGG